LDGSLRAECVLPIADRIAREHKSKVVLTHVVQLPDVLGWHMVADETRRVAEDFVQHIEAVAQNYLDQLHERQYIDTNGVIVQAGNAAIALAQIAAQQESDLIIVSAHGASANPIRSIGDTAHSLLAHCQQPILIYQDRPEHQTLDIEAAPVREQEQRPVGYTHLSGPTMPLPEA
jgi:nucleotide-binding universal stress UspA family protein